MIEVALQVVQRCSRTALVLLIFIHCLCGADELKVGFGSCHQVSGDLQIWDAIRAEDLDVWIWGGDIIYAGDEDTETHKRLYRELLALPAYKALREHTEILGTWDDNDFGINDGGADYPAKAQSQQAFLDFLGVPADSPRRKQEGIYWSKDFNVGTYLVRIVLLDVRYFRQVPGRTADILGVAQWRWLARQLQVATNLTVLVSGSQVIPQDHTYERWDQYPESRRFLFDLIERSPNRNFVILSGDRHFGEFSSVTIGGKRVLELTSSGMSHAWEGKPFEPNSHRVGQILPSRNYGVISLRSSRVELEDAEFHGTVALKTFGGKVHEQHQLKLYPDRGQNNMLFPEIMKSCS